MTVQKIEKAFKITLPKHTVLIEFKGNLTVGMKEKIAEELRLAIKENLDKEVTIESCLAVMNHEYHGCTEKNITVTTHGEENQYTNVSTKGWSFSNHPSDSVITRKVA